MWMAFATDIMTTLSVTHYVPGAVDPLLVFLTTAHEEGHCYGPIVQMRKLRRREWKWLARGQAAKEGQKQDSS